MTKLYIKDMNKEQLIKVFENNEKLREVVYNDYVEMTMLQISDWFYLLEDSLRSWSYGVCDGNEHITRKDDNSFLLSLKEVADYSVFFTDELELIDRLLEGVENLYYMEWDNKNYDKLESWINKHLDRFEYKIISIINDQLDVDNSHLVSEWREYYSEQDYHEDKYINADDESFELFEDVSYTKSYQ